MWIITREDTMKLVKHPDKKLKKICTPCSFIPDEDMVKEMVSVIEKHKGVGLAAPQIGITERFFILAPHGPKGDITLCVDPFVVRHGKSLQNMAEGCLSGTNDKGQIIYKDSHRWEVIDVEYRNEKDERVNRTLKRWEARIFQHEIDHLNGKCLNA